MLQFAQKQGRLKRKALLVNGGGGLDFEALKNDIHVEEPQPLPGDAFDRMKADPALIAMKKRFAWSAGAVLTLVVVATIFHLNRESWFPQSNAPVLAPVIDDVASSAPALLPKDTRIATAARPDKKPEKLDFTAAEKSGGPAAPNSPAAVRLPTPASTPGPPKIGAKTPVPGALADPQSGVEKFTSAPSAKVPNTVGALPRSLFRIARKKPAQQIEHDVAKARSALTQFLKAQTVDQRLERVADRAEIEPRMRMFSLKNGAAAMPFTKITDSEVVGNGTISEHDVSLADGRVLRVSVLKAADGSYLVDWPSFVGEGELDWAELMQRKPDLPVMLRASVEAASFFGGDFSDAKWLLCVKLMHPARPTAPPIFAYVDRKSVLGREIDYWMKLGENQTVPMTVRVKYPPLAGSDNQVWLSDLVAPGWVLRGGHPVVEVKGVAAP